MVRALSMYERANDVVYDCSAMYNVGVHFENRATGVEMKVSRSLSVYLKANDKCCDYSAKVHFTSGFEKRSGGNGEVFVTRCVYV